MKLTQGMLALFVCAFLFTATNSLAQGEPIIAPEVGRLIAEEGIDAAKLRFNELAKSQELDFAVETQGLHTLLSTYMQAGNNAAAQAVAEMAGQLTQTMISSQMGAEMSQMQQAEQDARERERKNQKMDQELEEKRQAQGQGQSRSDLQRFTGLYGGKGDPDSGKTVFVAVSCDGYLVSGAMWADVGSWWMRSASDRVFTYSDSFMSFSMEFEPDPANGRHVVSHELEGVGSPLYWKEDLPEDYAKCIERPRR